jgi:K+/H+ antiporter YhaU regulatory subunit KhtT
VLKAGDLIAVVGTEDAIEKLAAILDGNKPDSS